MDLGVGIGLRPPYYRFFENNFPKPIRWVEVVTENYLSWKLNQPIRPLVTLLRVRRNGPVALHGVSMSLGSTDPLDFEYLARLKQLIEQIEPAVVSDHLCWTGVDQVKLHELLPLPYTQKVIDHLVERILRVQDYLGRSILVENVSSYIRYPDSQMSEAEFVAQVSRQSGCQVLLDLNNIYVSSQNHRFDPLEYLNWFTATQVGQIHIAGHIVREDGTWVDTHSEPVCPEVWDLYRQACKRYGPVSAMIERDSNFPEWGELLAETRQLERIRNEVFDHGRTQTASA